MGEQVVPDVRKQVLWRRYGTIIRASRAVVIAGGVIQAGIGLWELATDRDPQVLRLCLFTVIVSVCAVQAADAFMRVFRQRP